MYRYFFIKNSSFNCSTPITKFFEFKVLFIPFKTKISLPSVSIFTKELFKVCFLINLSRVFDLT